MKLDNQVGLFMLSENNITGEDFPYVYKGTLDVVEATWIAIDEINNSLIEAERKA